MRDKKYYIALDDFERRVVMNCLNEMRNKLIAGGKYTDAVDEVLLKIIGGKIAFLTAHTRRAQLIFLSIQASPHWSSSDLKS